MHHLGVAIYDQVRVVGNDDDLPFELLLPDLTDDQVVDELVVQVSLRLIEHQRLLAVGKEEGKHGSRPLTSRGLGDRLQIRAVAKTAVFDLQSIFREPCQCAIQKLGIALRLPLKVVVKVAAEIAVAIASPADARLELLNAGFDRRVSLSGLLRQVPEQPAHGSHEVIRESVVRNPQFLPQRDLDGLRIIVVWTVPDTNEWVAGERGGQKVLASCAHVAARFQNRSQQRLRLLLKSALLFSARNPDRPARCRAVADPVPGDRIR